MTIARVTLAAQDRLTEPASMRLRKESDASLPKGEAIRYADQMFLDTKIDAAYNELKKALLRTAIMELGAFIAFHTAW